MASALLLLDLDGTVWDSHPLYASVLAPESGLTEAAIIEQLRTGRNVIEMARRFLGAGETFARRCHGILHTLRLYEGVASTLEILAAADTRLGVITNLPGYLVKPILIDLELVEYFDVLKFAAGKPSGRAIASSIQHSQVNPDSIWYVGDTSSDLLAARSAGISFAWAEWGYASKFPGADRTLRAFPEVLQL